TADRCPADRSADRCSTDGSADRHGAAPEAAHSPDGAAPGAAHSPHRTAPGAAHSPDGTAHGPCRTAQEAERRWRGEKAVNYGAGVRSLRQPDGRLTVFRRAASSAALVMLRPMALDETARACRGTNIPTTCRSATGRCWRAKSIRSSPGSTSTG